MKILPFLFMLGVACSSLPSASKASALGTIENFYKLFLDPKAGKIELPYSKSFQALVQENLNICELHAGTDICGWGTGGDEYLNAQEYSPNLTISSSGFKAVEEKNNVIKVNLNVYPELKDSYYDREIRYQMIFEDSEWVVDDLLYKEGSFSAREMMLKEIETYKPK
jgi:hypothetical protein